MDTMNVVKARRQGELLFVRLPAEVAALFSFGPVVSAASGITMEAVGSLDIREGEATGHVHRASGGELMRITRRGFLSGVPAALAGMVAAGSMLLKADVPVVISHPEHGDMALEAGTHLISVQREYDESQIRRVMD